MSGMKSRLPALMMPLSVVREAVLEGEERSDRSERFRAGFREAPGAAVAGETARPACAGAKRVRGSLVCGRGKKRFG